MSAEHDRESLLFAMRQELLRLARVEDDLADTEAASVHYWEPLPPTIQARRLAARLLRADADRFLSTMALGA